MPGDDYAAGTLTPVVCKSGIYICTVWGKKCCHIFFKYDFKLLFYDRKYQTHFVEFSAEVGYFKHLQEWNNMHFVWFSM